MWNRKHLRFGLRGNNYRNIRRPSDVLECVAKADAKMPMKVETTRAPQFQAKTWSRHGIALLMKAYWQVMPGASAPSMHDAYIIGARVLSLPWS